MKLKTASLSLAIPAGILLGSLIPAGVQPQGAPPVDLTGAIGVVDLEEVRKGYQKARTLREAWTEETVAVNQRLKQGDDSLEKLRLEADGWDRFTTKWIQAQADLEAGRAQLAAIKELEERRLLVKQMEANDEIFRDIDRAIQQLAAKKGLQLVLRVSPNLGAEDSLETRVGAWPVRSVWYHHPKLDITKDVVDFLKSPDFAGNGAAKPQNGK